MAAALTQMEAQAFTDSRASLWEALVAAIGEPKAMEIFGALTGEKVDFIIHTVVRGYQMSMRGQSVRGEVPFPLDNGRTEDPNDEIPF